MLRHQDFVPKLLKPAAFFTPAEHESFDEALAEANRWIKEHDVKVVNVETVVLPNIWNRFEEGSKDPALGVGDSVPHFWHQFIRVWYEVGDLRHSPLDQ